MERREYDVSVFPPVRMVVCKKCKNRRKYCAKNMCNLCYAKIRNKKSSRKYNLVF